MNREYWIDADDYLVYGLREKDEWESVANIPQHHVESLSKIVGLHNDLLLVCRYAEADLSGLVSDYFDVDIKTSKEPQAKTIRELRAIIAKAG